MDTTTTTVTTTICLCVSMCVFLVFCSNLLFVSFVCTFFFHFRLGFFAVFLFFLCIVNVIKFHLMSQFRQLIHML